MGKEIIEVDDDDGVFLSMLDAAEAEALSACKSKRQKVSAGGGHPEVPEGPYMAALRGSRSTLWQQQQDLRPRQKKDGIGSSSGGGTLRPGSNPSAASAPSDAGACFKCGMSGHWARDCTAAGGPEGQGGGPEGEVPEKACPCGSGTCLVLTSNTAKNPGRRFYRCPLRAENGGCNFFEWCDNPASGISVSRSTSIYQPDSSLPDLPCPCGAGSCLVLITKTGKNVGQQYYRCPAMEGRGSCGFFKWCSEPISVPSQPAAASQYNPTSQFSGERNGSSCFKCGQEGHWARDCPAPSSDYRADVGANRADVGANRVASSGSGTCFKCGKGGHWARDCPTQDTSAGTGGRKAPDSSGTPFSYRRR